MNYMREARKMLESWGFIQRSESSWFGGFMMGAGFGAVAGAAAAVLLTPSTGREMRKLVSKKAKQLAVTAERTLAEHPRHNGTREQHA